MRDDWFVSIPSVARGIRHMKRYTGDGPQAKWSIARLRGSGWRFWLHAWTPIWHDGRGPYLSVGLGRIGIYRGY